MDVIRQILSQFVVILLSASVGAAGVTKLLWPEAILGG